MFDLGRMSTISEYGMSKDKFTLKEPRYFSYLDEVHFYDWLKSIEGVIDIVGGAEGLVVTVSENGLSRDGLYDLLAILTRYSLSIDPVSQIVGQSDVAWFNDPLAYWNKKKAT